MWNPVGKMHSLTLTLGVNFILLRTLVALCVHPHDLQDTIVGKQATDEVFQSPTKGCCTSLWGSQVCFTRSVVFT